MIKTGIIGGAGYTAGELLRLLLHHPEAEITFVHSTSNAGKHLADIHGGITGETTLTFTDRLPLDTVDALFLCSPHGYSQQFMQENTLPPHLKIIDLSADHRAPSPTHTFLYGLPELNKNHIRNATRIANPGCFATAIQLALLPLAAQQILTDDVHVHALTGATGAGAIPSASTHFSWRDHNISLYKAFEHQHLAEINRSIAQLQPGCPATIHFIPLRGDFPRGIFATAYTRCKLPEDAIHDLYADFYRDAPFTHVADKSPDLKQAVNTNKCILHTQKYGDRLLITSVLDNLLKGASGQALQNFNLIFGLHETTGLQLKASGF